MCGDCPDATKTDCRIDFHCTEKIATGKRHFPQHAAQPCKLVWTYSINYIINLVVTVPFNMYECGLCRRTN